MSKIDKMSIQGIRSFPGGTNETIQFFQPLTLVVGVNGSGKTTIIECLKYVLTGVMPPNTKVGGAFIHDPSLTGDKEIMAQVKLQFASTQKHNLVVSRSLQLTVKKTARSLKTLECALKMRRHGETTTISSRVAEMDLLLPQYLGVSTAVIDNVIFCHQEESLWPLSDPSTLKKKFDEIFEAQKYTKAIKNIRDIGKEKKQQLNEYKIHEQNAKVDKDRARKAEKRSVALRDDIESLREKVEDLGRQMKQVSDRAHKAFAESEEYSRIVGQLEGKRIEARSKQTTIDDLKLNLKEVEESDEWLESTLAQFDTRQKELNAGMKTRQEQYITCSDQIKAHRTQLDTKLAARGKYEQEKEAYQRQLRHRKDTVRDTAAKHEIRGYDDLTDDKLVDEFLFRMRKTMKDQQRLLDNAKRNHDEAKRDAQSLVNKLSEKKSSVQDSKIAAKRQIALNDREAGEFQKKVNEIKVDEGSKAVINSRVEELSKKIESSRKAAQSAGWDTQLQEANARQHERELEESRLEAEQLQATKRANSMAQFAHIKKELKERETSLQTLLSAHSERVSSFLGRDWTAATVEQLYQDTVESTLKETASAERERDAVKRQLEQVNFKLKAARDGLLKNQATVTECEQKISEATDGDGASDYEQNLLDAQVAADNARQGTKGSQQLHDYFLRILETLNKPQPSCRVCSRGFKSKEDKSYKAMKANVEKNIQQTLQEMKEVDVEYYESHLKELLDLKVPFETWKALTEKAIPDQKEEIDTLVKEHEKNVAEIEKRDRVVEKQQQDRKELESISKTASSLAKCDADIRSLRSQVEELSARQSQSGGYRTLEDIQEDIEKVRTQLRDAKKSISRLTTERDGSRSELSGMELELRDLRADLSNVNYQLEKKASLAERVDEFKAQNQKQREAVDRADKDLEQLDPQISTAKTKYEDVVQRADTKERELSHEASRLSESVQGLDMLNQQIEHYVSNGGDSRLTTTNREIKSLEDEINNFTAEQGRITREVNKINDQIKDSDTTRRQYADNLRYRRSTKALALLTTEIEELESHNAEVDRDRLKEESEQFTRQHQNLTAKQAGYMGEMRSKDKELEVILQDFKTDYMDAPQRYREAHIKVETTKAAVEDLTRYSGALDKAIMKYHSLKMGEINNTIDELWRNTYQGTDVDTIMIKAENDTGGSNRSYNYRTVMVKQGTEMDMRGRCSAGQKVLASIIIRLALAECFSANCGLISLDEPTTNLDRDNIEALAKSLHGIIKVRQQQSNFQLIVITHDEDFLRHMQCADFTDYYYRVSRDGSANSQIEQQSIGEVM